MALSRLLSKCETWAKVVDHPSSLAFSFFSSRPPSHPTLGCGFCLLFCPSFLLVSGYFIQHHPLTHAIMPLHASSPHHQHQHHHYIPSHAPIMEGDAGRRYSGAQRHKQQHAENPNGTLSTSSTSPRSPRTPYPLPYHHLLSKTTHAPPSFLDIPSTVIDDPTIHQRHSLPDVVVSSTPTARTRFVSLPLSLLPAVPLPRAEITESDRLERACGRVPAAILRVPMRDDPPPSSPHQPRSTNGGAHVPMAPKWPHWTLVLRIKRVLRREGKDVRDYVEAAQIDEMFRRDVEERARREARKGSESGDDNSRWCFFFRALF